jgi:rRNA maturation protein Nop10
MGNFITNTIRFIIIGFGVLAWVASVERLVEAIFLFQHPRAAGESLWYFLVGVAFVVVGSIGGRLPRCPKCGKYALEKKETLSTEDDPAPYYDLRAARGYTIFFRERCSKCGFERQNSRHCDYNDS